MFCPRCSQQQLSEETRFCPRCGFQLGVVKALLANDEAAAPVFNAAVTPAAVRAGNSLRKRDVTVGAALMFVVALLLAIITGDTPPSRSALVFLLAVAWVLLSLVVNIGPLVRYLFNGESAAPGGQSASQLARAAVALAVGASRAALPPRRTTPASDFVRRPADTAEVSPAQPPSVAEPTTNLLHRN
jgi:hypothetical protein